MINKAVILGNLGADPEVRQSQSGVTLANFNVATTSKWKDRDGQQQEQTEWHRIVVFGRLAEVCEQYLRKGSKVYIEGRIQTRQWDDRDGNERYTTEIVAGEMKMLDSRQDISARDDRSMVSDTKSVVNEWPPQEFVTKKKNTLSIGDDPFSDAEIPF